MAWPFLTSTEVSGIEQYPYAFVQLDVQRDRFSGMASQDASICDTIAFLRVVLSSLLCMWFVYAMLSHEMLALCLLRRSWCVLFVGSVQELKVEGSWRIGSEMYT
jgi:hypothetical protein